jgi:DNA-binding LacI/PurR family transcriptional regulator
MLSVPGDVSLACLDDNPFFSWFSPPIAHLALDSRPWIRGVLRWAEDVAAGVENHRKSINEAKLVDGCMIGPVPGGRAEA